MARRFDLARPLLAIALLAGCAGVPQQRFYTLGNRLPAPVPAAAAVSASASASASAIAAPFAGVVRLASVTIPETVDRPQLVLRAGDNQVVVLDNERWAESLRSGVARVLAAELSAQLGGATVLGRSERGSRDAATAVILVAVDISRLDASLQEGVWLDASWSVRAAAGNAAGETGMPLTGAARVHEPATGSGIAAAVAAHDRALAQIGAVLARDVRRAIAIGHADAPVRAGR